MAISNVLLQQDFKYGFNLGQNALNCEDPEEAKALAKNIDRAQLNKAYYDYFFEGFMLSLATKFLPILVLLAYVNEAYQPANLLQLFGQDYVFRFGGDSAGATPVGAAFRTSTSTRTRMKRQTSSSEIDIALIW